MKPAVTKHSLLRSKKRLGLNKRCAEKVISTALIRGKTAENFSSWEKTYLESEGLNGCQAIAYNGFCFIVSRGNTCITLYRLPSWFGQKKHFDGKTKIRNAKKYYKYHKDVEYRSYL